MHEHSDKIQPKKLAVTIILAILLLGYGWYLRTSSSSEKEKMSDTASSTTMQLEPK